MSPSNTPEGREVMEFERISEEGKRKKARRKREKRVWAKVTKEGQMMKNIRWKGGERVLTKEDGERRNEERD